MEKDNRAIVEAILFASPRRLTTQEIAEKSGLKINATKRTLKELKNDKFVSGVTLSEHNGVWKLQVHGDYKNVVRDVTKIEFPKSLIGTLSVIAYKNGVNQSEVIKVRGNKAYSHIADLTKLGFITSKPHGRTKKLKLAQKFYEYFDIAKSDVKRLFKQ